MRAVMIRNPGGVEALEIADVPRPEPGPEDLLVRNFATALNRADLLQRRGLYPPPPGASEILGLEFAGEVAAFGESVEGFRVGDGVFGLVPGGGYAEFITVPADQAIRMPENLSFDAAATLPEAFMVADEALFDLGRLDSGGHVLIHAGASGVGSAAIQLAKARGVTALATTGTAAKCEPCERLGAARAIDYKTESMVRVVTEETAGRGVDAVLDLVGARHWDSTLECLRSGGRIVIIGLMGGQTVALDLSLLLKKRLHIVGTVMRGRSSEERRTLAERFRRRVLPLVESGEVTPVLDSVFPLEDVRAAHERMEANSNVGKIVLRL